MKTHQVEGRRYSCKHCSEEFLSQGSLKYHISKTHVDHLEIFKTEANEWKCQSCEYVTNTKDKLMKHLTVHQSPKFKCDQCDKAFRRAARLKEHQINAHNSKTLEFPCPHCSQVFRIADSRRSHISKKHQNVLKSRK